MHGHNKPITALTMSPDKKFVFTADFEGHISNIYKSIFIPKYLARWDISTAESKRVCPSIHKSQVVGLRVANNGTLISVGWDDTLQFTLESTKSVG